MRASLLDLSRATRSTTCLFPFYMQVVSFFTLSWELCRRSSDPAEHVRTGLPAAYITGCGPYSRVQINRVRLLILLVVSLPGGRRRRAGTPSVEAAGQVFNQTNEFVYLVGNVNHNTDLSIKVDRRIRNA